MHRLLGKAQPIMPPTPPGKMLGDIIYKSRMDLGLTQDEFGQRYSVSGPAIFKFEKGHVRPSLKLWLRIAADSELTERRAVLLWLKSKLPKQYQRYVDLAAAIADRPRTKKGLIDYSSFETREAMHAAVGKDKKLPKPLRALLADDELWALYKPTGHEINLLRDMFSPLGKGSKKAFREALYLIREFIHSF